MVGILLALCCVGAAGGGFALYWVVNNSTEPLQDETRAFLADLQAADYPSAYDRLCTLVRTGHSQADFEEAVRARGWDRVVEHSIRGASVEWGNGIGTGTVTADLTLDDGTSSSYTFPLLNEDGDWKICGTPF